MHADNHRPMRSAGSAAWRVLCRFHLSEGSESMALRENNEATRTTTITGNCGSPIWVNIVNLSGLLKRTPLRLLRLPSRRPILFHPCADSFPGRCRHRSPRPLGFSLCLVCASSDDELDGQFVLVKRIAQMRKRHHQPLGFIEQFLQSDGGTAFGKFENVRWMSGHDQGAYQR